MTKKGVISGGVIIALVVALFHFFGVTDSGYDAATATHSLFVWLARRWTSYSYTQDDFPYGWSAPIVALWMVWHLRHGLADAAKRVNIAGLAVIVLALLLHWVGARTQQTRISFIALLLLLWGIPFYLFGWRVARKLIVPVGFLSFTIQLDFLSGFALKFRQAQAAGAVELLNGLGVHAVRSGRGILLGAEVCAAESASGGLRSLMLIAEISVAFAWLRQRGLIRQCLFVAAVPLVVFLAAIIRLSLQGMLLSAGFAHAGNLGSPWVDYAFYAAAFLLLLAWHRVLASPRRFGLARTKPEEEP